MITVSCLAALLFFGGWLSPFPEGAAFAWTRYLPAALLAAGGLLIIVDGIRYLTTLGRIVLPALGLGMLGLAWLCAQPGIIDFVQGPFWFLSKVVTFLFMYVWVRGTLPRFRYDQLMGFGWKFLLPASLANVLLTSLAIVVAG